MGDFGKSMGTHRNMKEEIWPHLQGYPRKGRRTIEGEKEKNCEKGFPYSEKQSRNCNGKPS